MLPVVALTVLLYAGFLTSIIVMYIFFAPSAGCSRNIAFVTFTLILSVAVSVLSVSSIRIETAGLLTAGLMCAYGAWLCASALYSAPLDSCSTLTDNDTDGGHGSTWLTVCCPVQFQPPVKVGCCF
jgi:Serine incorporator (Serinc)